MKKALRFSLIGLWVLVLSFFLTRWWVTSDSARLLPTFPDTFWLALDNFFGVQSPEGQFGVAVVVGFVLSVIVVWSLTLLGFILWRRIQSALTTGSTGRRR